MRVLMFTLDPKMADPESGVRARHREYAALFDELMVIVLGRSSRAGVEHDGRLTVVTRPHTGLPKPLYWITGLIWGVREGRRQLGRLRAATEGNGENALNKRLCEGLSPKQPRPGLLRSTSQRRKLSEPLRSEENGGWKSRVVVSSPEPFGVGLIAYLVARPLGVPLHLQIHTDISSEAWRTENLRNRLFSILAKFLLPRAQSIRVVSERLKQMLETDSRFKIQDSRVTVLPIFVDTEKYHTAIPAFDLKQKYPQFDKIVLWVGRLTPEKDPAKAIQVFCKILKQFPRAGLIMVGDGPERRELESRVKIQDSRTSGPEPLRPTPYVVFAGWQNDLIPYYKGADALFVTSKYEGYGMQIVEALASGCPVVSTDISIAREAGARIGTSEEELVVLLGKALTEGKESSGINLPPQFTITKQEYLERYRTMFEETAAE